MNATNGAYDGQVMPVPGGVLIRDAKSRVMGAVGVTGGTPENDAEVAVNAIEAVGLAADA